jgi:hypothetical protein
MREFDALVSLVADYDASPPHDPPRVMQREIDAIRVLLLREQLRMGNNAASAVAARRYGGDAAHVLFGDVVDEIRSAGWVLTPPDDGR